jgi:hypothetical protein
LHGARYNGSPKVTVTAGGADVVSHAGARLLADMADRTGLTEGLSAALSGLRQCAGGHDPGRVLADLAVMIADGGTTISDLAALRHQQDLSGSVASTSTAWRLLDAINAELLAAIRGAHAVARGQLWAAREDRRDATGGLLDTHRAEDKDMARAAHRARRDAGHLSQREAGRRPDVQARIGLPPLLAFLDNTC